MSDRSNRLLRFPAQLLTPALLLFFTVPSAVLPQVVGQASDTLLILAPGDTLLRLGRGFVLPGTLTLSSDSALLLPGRDYTLDGRNGIVRLPGAVRTRLGRPGADTVRVHAVFEFLPFTLRDEYRLRSPVILRDTASGRVDTIYRTAADFTSEDFFGPRLRKSGSLVRGIQAGSNTDLTLNSGFRLEMSGNLSDDLEVLASLTDENSPLQPEGTTQTLQELDRVFIELRSPAASATLGDLSLGFSEGTFGRLNRKLRGALGSWSSPDGAVQGRAEAGAASVRGIYTSNRFQGADGVQGPYRLTGKNNEIPLIVIAGTERVYVDGLEVTRGLLNDYTIDYSLGEVTFTSRRRITFASRIVVEFEYTDRNYARSFLGGRAGAASADGRWRIGAMVVREDDDENAPQDLTLSPADRQTLAAAGDSPGRATRSGIDSAGVGKGRYELRDTTVFFPVGGRSVDTTILVFNPADTLRALYNAVFTYVGPNGGDYEKVATGQYRYAGPGKGGYLPVRLLPFPERRAFANVVVSGSPAAGLSVTGEYAASSFDRNVFSTLDDADNQGGAYDVALSFQRPELSLAGVSLASVGLTLRQRRTGENFAPPERYKEVEFARDWNTGADSTGRDLLRDAELTVSPVKGFSVGAYAGNLKRGDSFSSERYSSTLSAGREFRYSFEYLRSDDALSALSTERLRQDGTGRLVFAHVAPGLAWHSERLTDRGAADGALLPTSYRFAELIPGISFDSLLGMGFSAGLGYRRDDSVRNGGLARAVETFSQTYGWKYEGGEWVNSTLDLLLQKRTFDSSYAGRNTRNTALVRSLTRLAPWKRAVQADLYYEVSPERSSRLERLFVQVPLGTGNYRYAGDLNGNGVVDEPDFRPVKYDGDYTLVTVPTDSLVPVLNLKSSARFRFDMSRLFPPGGAQGASRFLSPLSGETYLRIEEKSADSVKRNVYLLRLGTFRSPATTLQGIVLFRQELNLYEFDPGFSVKVTYQQRRGFTRLSTGDEAAYSRERGVRVRWSLGDDLSNQVQFRHLTDGVSATPASARDRSVRATLLDLDWTYRPVEEIESTFGLSIGDANNYELSTASLNAERLSVSWMFQNAGRLRTEFSREEAVVSGISTDIPFELTQGRMPGKTWIWGCNFEYRLTRFLESSMRYEGRKEGILRTIHSGNLEVRALF